MFKNKNKFRIKEEIERGTKGDYTVYYVQEKNIFGFYRPVTYQEHTPVGPIEFKIGRDTVEEAQNFIQHYADKDGEIEIEYMSIDDSLSGENDFEDSVKLETIRGVFNTMSSESKRKVVDSLQQEIEEKNDKYKDTSFFKGWLKKKESGKNHGMAETEWM